MGMGPITWTCVLLAMHQTAPAEEFHINDRNLSIPIRLFDPERRGQISRFLLYVSADRGQSWACKGKVPSDAKEFRFQAPADGPYWFTVANEDARGQQYPPDVYKAPPAQRVVVDTVVPDVYQVTTQRQPGGEIHVQWKIREDHPDLRSFRLDYHTAERGWTPLPVHQLGLEGEERFPPGSSGEVLVRVRLRDLAANEGVREARVPAVGGPASPTMGGPSPIGPIPPWSSDPGARSATLTSREATRPPPVEPPAPAPPAAPSVPLGSRDLPPAHPAPFPGLAASNATPPGPPSRVPETPRGALPPVQIVSKREVKLGFTVDKVGPSGIGGVEVYVTCNEGARWEPMRGKLPVSLPPAGVGPIKGSVTVPLTQDAVVYGFFVVAKSNAGQGKPPRPGDPPQARLELDTTAPKAALFQPLPDPSNPNSLVLNWMASDLHLTATPITLEWSPNRDGPWSAIGGEQLPNAPGTASSLPDGATGSCTWRLPERAPAHVYLKLTVRDTAGNVGVALTEKPVLIDLSVPETTITSVSPAG